MAAKSGGCFPGDALVKLEGGGQTSLSELRPGDRVLAWTGDGDGGGGELVYSEVLTFLDRDPASMKLYYALSTASGAELRLTAAHLVFVTEWNCSEGAEPARGALRAVYAADARPGQCALVSDGVGGRLSRVTRVALREARGALAPLTGQGTVVVDGVVASCYAVVDRHALAHLAFSPLRLMHRWTGAAGHHGDGIHWYARFLRWLGGKLLDSGRLHPLGVATDDS